MSKGYIRGGRGSNSGITSNNESVEYYVSGDGMFINQYLRGNVGSDFGELSQNEKQYLKDLDKATSEKLGEPQTVYRSLDAGVLFNGITSSEYNSLKNNLVYGDNQKYTVDVSNKAKSKLIQKYNEKGFMSTTTSRSYADDFGGFTGSDMPVVARIKTSKNTKGVNIGKKYPALEKRMQQKEVLLGRNQTGKITNLYGKNGNIYVDIEME